MRIKKEAKFWDVRITIPETRILSGKEYPYNQNIHIMVAAESADKVCELVKSEYPTATIHQVNHRGGDCGILVQKELLQANLYHDSSLPDNTIQFNSAIGEVARIDADGIMHFTVSASDENALLFIDCIQRSTKTRLNGINIRYDL